MSRVTGAQPTASISRKIEDLAEALAKSRAIVFGRPCVSISSYELSRILNIRYRGLSIDSTLQHIVREIGRRVGAVAAVSVRSCYSIKIYFVFDRRHMLDIVTYFAKLRDKNIIVYDFERDVMLNASHVTGVDRVELVFAPGVKGLENLVKLYRDMYEEAYRSGLLRYVDLCLDLFNVKIRFRPENAPEARHVVKLVRKYAPNARLTRVILYYRFLPELMEPPKIRGEPVSALMEVKVRYRTQHRKNPKHVESAVLYAALHGLKITQDDRDSTLLKIEYVPGMEDKVEELLNMTASERYIRHIEYRYVIDVESERTKARS